MSLEKNIKQVTKQALAQMSSIGENVLYSRVAGNITYNTDTGAPSRPSIGVPLKAWFTSFEERQIDGNNVQPGDKRCTFPIQSLPFEPQLNDRVTDESGEIWEVMNFKIPPPKCLFILQVRRP